jgi:hypothetical protein
VRIELEYTAGPDGRPEGFVKGPDETDPRSFTGTIELLRLLEDLTREADVR